MRLVILFEGTVSCIHVAIFHSMYCIIYIQQWRKHALEAESTVVTLKKELSEQQESYEGLITENEENIQKVNSLVILVVIIKCAKLMTQASTTYKAVKRKTQNFDCLFLVNYYHNVVKFTMCHTVGGRQLRMCNHVLFHNGKQCFMVVFFAKYLVNFSVN